MRAAHTGTDGPRSLRGMPYLVESILDSQAGIVGVVVFLGLGVMVVLFVSFFRGYCWRWLGFRCVVRESGA